MKTSTKKGTDLNFNYYLSIFLFKSLFIALRYTSYSLSVTIFLFYISVTIENIIKASPRYAIIYWLQNVFTYLDIHIVTFDYAWSVYSTWSFYIIFMIIICKFLLQMALGKEIRLPFLSSPIFLSVLATMCASISILSTFLRPTMDRFMDVLMIQIIFLFTAFLSFFGAYFLKIILAKIDEIVKTHEEETA